MKVPQRVLLGAGCIALLLISWLMVVGAKSNADKQAELMDQAAAYLADGVYIRAQPLLEEAAGYNTPRTIEAEEALKTVYLHMIDENGYSGKYIGLLGKQMARRDAPPDVFSEAARYYLNMDKLPDALAVLKEGIQKTGSEALTDLYEKNRYGYSTKRAYYDDVTAIYNGTIQVRSDGAWGLALADGSLIIPCEYDKISTYNAGGAIVKKDGEIFAVDTYGHRLAKCHEPASDFGNFTDGCVPLLIEGQWRRATGEFVSGSLAFEDIGAYAGGYAAVKLNGRWGVIGISADWLAEPEYDEIIMDELGRCWAQDAFFARRDRTVCLIVSGETLPGTYEDARPFADGWAAVKQGGKWGFIDTSGTVRIDCQFEDALSFGQHLAAVKQDGLWGYISLYGEWAISPQFEMAGRFSDGSAPVLSEGGWQFITLTEFRKEAGLL